jgi:hypothetical protein
MTKSRGIRVAKVQVTKGGKWNRWTILRTTTGANNNASCRCECGAQKHVRVSNLINATSRSCGCLIGDTHRTHGQSGSPEYEAWERLNARCHNKNFKQYEDYGGRGIRVAKVWRGRSGFAAFLAHVGKRPSPDHSIDRFPDMNGNYEPGNVRWATRTEQNQNTRRNVMLMFRGETRCVSEWARIVGIGKKTISCRLKRGWSTRDALMNAPVPTRIY